MKKTVTHEEFVKIFNSKFSPEITDEEAVAFLNSCPLVYMRGILVTTYLLGRAIVDPLPYDALRRCVESYVIATSEEEEEE